MSFGRHCQKRVLLHLKTCIFFSDAKVYTVFYIRGFGINSTVVNFVPDLLETRLGMLGVDVGVVLLYGNHPLDERCRLGDAHGL